MHFKPILFRKRNRILLIQSILLSILLLSSILLFTFFYIPVHGETNASPSPNAFETDAPSAVIMEASTGTVLYQKEDSTKRPPASVTKVMTLLLIFEALDKGQIHLQDTVTVSEHAASMGGSQVFLETGETQTVDTLIKCIAISSGNDACVSYTKRNFSCSHPLKPIRNTDLPIFMDFNAFDQR